ncbi:hypothetical protein AMAG_04878 [Allomyces macrogynus ATCC 38327]|uniref:Uncharacterized protein n=1 Tax=Allomyces macrogynus (strain ATCC 38327) TaxID=578462 RepID=A0A0L0S6V3_ALLM3|nr:hypothetical protein AMAG_04878 [Allomyces macrogynus ATCC 38327]|eukprot:KNE58054.1 hypothetical protein AMAG_04878 [Allomyces macrogynus ATCC 38327]
MLSAVVLRTRLHALLSSAWLAYTLGQIALVLYAAMYMQCPRPYLWSTPRLSLCASPWFLTALQPLQTCGAALFVTATLLRFRAALTVLSTKDGLICRVLSASSRFVRCAHHSHRRRSRDRRSYASMVERRATHAHPHDALHEPSYLFHVRCVRLDGAARSAARCFRAPRAEKSTCKTRFRCAGRLRKSRTHGA